MKATKMLLIAAVIGLVVFGAGCIGQGPETDIKSDQEAGQAVADIGERASDVGNIIDEVDKALG